MLTLLPVRADDASDQSWPKKPASPPSHPPGLEDCYWAGHWPFCMPKCGYGYKKVKQDECGDGHCCWMGKKSLCCVIPPPAKAPGGDDDSRGDHDRDNDDHHHHHGNEDDDY